MNDRTVTHRLLVVDDDLSFQSFLSAMLKKMGVDSDVALTGRDAMGRLRTRQHSGVLLDLRLPDVDGLEVLRDLRGRGDATPVVVVTGAATVAATLEAMQLKVFGFLEKPVTAAHLASTIRALLALRRESHSGSPVVHEPTEQVAKIMNAVLRSPTDVPTVRAWCHMVGKSESSLYALFSSVNLHAKVALDLARMLRVACGAPIGGPGCNIDAADPRTITRFLRRAGVSREALYERSPEDLLRSQRLIDGHPVLDRLSIYMREDSGLRRNGGELEKIP